MQKTKELVSKRRSAENLKIFVEGPSIKYVRRRERHGESRQRSVTAHKGGEGVKHHKYVHSLNVPTIIYFQIYFLLFR